MKLVTEQVGNSGVFRTTSQDSCCDCEGLGSSVQQSIRNFQRMHVNNERDAEREERHARYLDCGPQAWDGGE